MKHIKYIILGAFLLLFSSSMLAQDLKLTIHSDSIEMDGDTSVISSVMEKEGNQFVWKQRYGQNQSVETYTITNTSENWDTNSSLGAIQYTLVANGFETILNITGNSDGITITLSSTESNGQTETLFFNNSTITYN